MPKTMIARVKALILISMLVGLTIMGQPTVAAPCVASSHDPNLAPAADSYTPPTPDELQWFIPRAELR
jgi:hypothetical protein